MTRLLREERGSVFVLTAFLVPFVLLFLVAGIVDTGIWFTHKRQLQNRADAGALAAGVQYAANWAACADPAESTTHTVANAIDAAARQYAGDPGEPTQYNTEVTDDGTYSPT
jgi:Flp pilus assembly protein TadG